MVQNLNIYNLNSESPNEAKNKKYINFNSKQRSLTLENIFLFDRVISLKTTNNCINKMINNNDQETESNLGVVILIG